MPRIDAALDFAQQVVDSNALYFRANPAVAERLKAIRGQNRHYLAHEFFNADWHPVPFSDVAEHLAAAKLSFAASANLLAHIDSVNLTAAQQQMLSAITHPVLRESVRDYCENQQFRRDIFVKGALRAAAFMGYPPGAEHPALAAWLERVSARPSIRQAIRELAAGFAASQEPGNLFDARRLHWRSDRIECALRVGLGPWLLEEFAADRAFLSPLPSG